MREDFHRQIRLEGELQHVDGLGAEGDAYTPLIRALIKIILFNILLGFI